MFVGRRRGQDLAVAGEDVDLENRLMGQAGAEGRALDAESGDRAAEGDRLELWDDQRCEAVRQSGRDEVLVGAHAGDVGGARLGIHRDDPVESGDVQSRMRIGGALTKEVGRLLRKTHGCLRRDGTIAGQKVGNPLVECRSPHLEPVGHPVSLGLDQFARQSFRN